MRYQLQRYLTTTEAMITDKPEEKSAPAMPDMGGIWVVVCQA
jgi:hypothetical protein